METNPNEEFTPEDELKAENELLKLKIEMEYGGMSGGNDSALPPDIENEFLKHVMQFEEQYKNVKRVTVYEFIGGPEFKPAVELSGVFLEMELDRLQDIMIEKGMSIDFICDYDTLTKYKFITEELFQEETDDMHIEGMVTHFTYEEFHPNHEYDIKEYAQGFLKNLLEREWDEKFTTHELAKTIGMDGKEYTKDLFGQLIKNFKESFTGFDIIDWKINSVEFDVENCNGSLNGFISYKAFNEASNAIVIEGKVLIGFFLEWGLWLINTIEFPGLHS